MRIDHSCLGRNRVCRRVHVVLRLINTDAPEPPEISLSNALGVLLLASVWNRIARYPTPVQSNECLLLVEFCWHDFNSRETRHVQWTANNPLPCQPWATIPSTIPHKRLEEALWMDLFWQEFKPQEKQRRGRKSKSLFPTTRTFRLKKFLRPGLPRGISPGQDFRMQEVILMRRQSHCCKMMQTLMSRMILNSTVWCATSKPLFKIYIIYFVPCIHSCREFLLLSF